MRLILGSPGSGKTTRVLESVCAELQAGKRPLLVVPTRYLKDRFTSRIAGSMNGFAGTAVTTLSDLVANVVDSANLPEAVRTITDFESFLLVREILENNRARLEYFGDAVHRRHCQRPLLSRHRASAPLVETTREYSKILDTRLPKHRYVAFLYIEYVSRLAKQNCRTLTATTPSREDPRRG
jgi:hypothetical protein